MTREQIRPGAFIETTRALAYVDTDHLVKYAEPGTKGRILRVDEGPGGWSAVEVWFAGVAPFYRCDIKTAEWAFRALEK